MEYDLAKILSVQEETEGKFRKKLGLENTVLFDKIIVAFKVELGEFLNVTEVHKYWKENKRLYDRKDLIDEFCDCLAFLINIGLEKGWHRFANTVHIDPEDIGYRLDYIILDLFNNNLDSSGKWVNALHDLFRLGFECGLELKEIEEGFELVTLKNNRRIKGGY